MSRAAARTGDNNLSPRGVSSIVSGTGRKRGEEGHAWDTRNVACDRTIESSSPLMRACDLATGVCDDLRDGDVERIIIIIGDIEAALPGTRQ